MYPQIRGNLVSCRVYGESYARQRLACLVGSSLASRKSCLKGGIPSRFPFSSTSSVFPFSPKVAARKRSLLRVQSDNGDLQTAVAARPRDTWRDFGSLRLVPMLLSEKKCWCDLIFGAFLCKICLIDTYPVRCDQCHLEVEQGQSCCKAKTSRQLDRPCERRWNQAANNIAYKLREHRTFTSAIHSTAWDIIYLASDVVCDRDTFS